MSGRLEGKVAIITGASGGLGVSQAMLMAKEGAKLLVTDLSADGDEFRKSLSDLVADIEKAGGEAAWKTLDVTNESDWQSAVAAAERRFGKVDILSNNAGIYYHAGLLDHTVEEFHKITNVNQLGVLLGMKTVVPAMRRAGGGSIINFSSIYGISGAGVSTAYQATKGAVRLMSKSAALEFVGDNIRINSIHPGMFDTNLFETSVPKEAWEPLISLVPMKRFGRPEEIAWGVIYLASDEASFVTGSELVIDGGYTCP